MLTINFIIYTVNFARANYKNIVVLYITNCFAERKTKVEWFCLKNIVKGRIFIIWNYNLKSCSKFGLIGICCHRIYKRKCKTYQKEKKICGFPVQCIFFPRRVNGFDSFPTLWNGETNEKNRGCQIKGRTPCLYEQ